jgi:hypothetical protein
MDYVTRQFINLTKKFRKELPKLADLLHHDLKQQTEAIRTQNKCAEERREVQPIWLEPILTQYQQAERNRATQDDRHYRVQNSIRWATWCAFFAATIYAGVSARLLMETKKATIAAQEQARHSGEMVSQAHDQFIDSIRPVVWLTQLGHPELFQNPSTNPPTGQMIWTYHYTTFGNNLAYNLSTISRAYKLGKNGVWHESFRVDEGSSTPNIQSIPLAPGTDVFGTAVSPPGLPPERFNKLKDTDEGISIKVVMKFEDSYGNIYYTGVCLTQLKLGAIQYCGGSYMSSKQPH